ncbi:MAG: hypothetical protein R3300_07155 [Candidatus Promineifilaceae bacterium]|nr:hypothetical protein [Candidatus Promineifilaceae bacterium]
MGIRNFLLLRAIIALAYAIGLLIIPAQLLQLYGVVPDVGSIAMSRFLAVELVAVGVLCLLARSLGDWSALRAVMQALLISEVIGLMVAVVVTTTGAFNALGWSIVVIYGSMSLGYVYFLFFKRPSTSLTSAE